MSEKIEKEKRWIDEIYMLCENEVWLNEQAKKGLILKSFDNRYATFEKGSLDNINYKIVVLDEEKAEEKIKSIENQGFTFVAKFKEYHIFYITSKCKNSQLELNEEMNAFVVKWFDKQIKNQFSMIGYLLGFIIVSFIVARFVGFFYKGILVGVLSRLLFEIPTVGYIIYGIIIALIIIKIVNEIFVLKKRKKFYLQNQKYLSVRNSIKSKIIRSVNVYVLIFTILIIVTPGIYCYINYVDEDEQVSISEIHESMPIVLIQDIEKEEGTEDELLDLQNDINIDDNYAVIDSNLFAPKQYYAHQIYRFRDREAHEIPYSFMNTTYYEVVNTTLAKVVTKELAIDAVNKNKIEKVEFNGFNKVYIYKKPYTIFVFACKEKQVMSIMYCGEQPVERILQEMAEVL